MVVMALRKLERNRSFESVPGSLVGYLLQFLDDLGKRPLSSGCHQFFLRRKVPVKATVCEADLLHEGRDADSVETTFPKSFRSGCHDLLPVSSHGFFACSQFGTPYSFRLRQYSNEQLTSICVILLPGTPRLQPSQ